MLGFMRSHSSSSVGGSPPCHGRRAGAVPVLMRPGRSAYSGSGGARKPDGSMMSSGASASYGTETTKRTGSKSVPRVSLPLRNRDASVGCE